jgi:putative addiction module CopG family antidote
LEDKEIAMTIHLTQELESFVQAKVQSGRFASEDEAITEAVRLLRQREPEHDESAENTVAAAEPVWQKLLRIMSTVPDEVFDRIPADSAEQLDHYIYGTPRRPAS